MPTPPRDPLDTLTLDPEALEKLRDLSTPSVSDPPRPQSEPAPPVAHRAARPKLPSIPFELKEPPAFVLTRQGSSSPEIEVRELDAAQHEGDEGSGEDAEGPVEPEKGRSRVGLLLFLLYVVLAAVVILVVTGLVDPGLLLSMLRDW